VSDHFIGYVDGVREDGSIAGWAIVKESQAVSPVVELVIGQTVLASTSANRLRPDVVEKIGIPATPGFVFPPNAIWGLLNLAPAELGRKLIVRIKGEGESLPGTALPKGTSLYNLALQTAIKPLQASKAVPRDLVAELSALKERASAFVKQPHAFVGTEPSGFVEGAFHLGGSLYVLVGWASGRVPLRGSGVVQIERRIPVGVWGGRYRRPDLPPDARAFVAALQCDVPLPSDLSEFLLFLHGEDKMVVTGTAEACLQAASTLPGFLDSLEGNMDTDAHKALMDLLENSLAWSLKPNDPAVSGVHAHVDRLFLIPGFGAGVQGWCVSPWRRVVDLALRVGKSTFVTMPGGFETYRRDDLRAVNPRPEVLSTAGISAILTGLFEASDMKDAALRLTLEDGANLIVPIEHGNIRMCRTPADIGAFANLYPGLENESYAEGLARGFVNWRRQSVLPLRTVSLASARRMIIVAISVDPDRAHLQLKMIARGMNHVPGDVGLALVIGETSNRGILRSHLPGFNTANQRPLAVFLVDHPAHVIHSLPRLLEITGCERFVYLGPGFLPQEAALGRLMENVDEESRKPVFADSIPAEADDGDGTVSIQAFGWSSKLFSDWIVDAPPMIQGHVADGGLASMPHVKALNARGWLMDDPVENISVELIDIATLSSWRQDVRGKKQ
jgi:hypothetical protein